MSTDRKQRIYDIVTTHGTFYSKAKMHYMKRDDAGYYITCQCDICDNGITYEPAFGFGGYDVCLVCVEKGLVKTEQVERPLPPGTMSRFFHNAKGQKVGQCVKCNNIVAFVLRNEEINMSLCLKCVHKLSKLNFDVYHAFLPSSSCDEVEPEPEPVLLQEADPQV